MSFQPRPYQLAGAAALANNTHFLLADAPGLGKTAQAILAVRQRNERGFRALIVCPAHVRDTWRAEIPIVWSGADTPEVRVISHTAPVPLDDLAERAFVVVSYNGVGAVLQASYDKPFDYIIFDESQFLKSAVSKRTLACLPGHARGKARYLQGARRWFLTGTPLVSKPLDVFPTLRAIYEHGLGKPFYTSPRFAEHFCAFRVVEHGFKKNGVWWPRNVFVEPRNVTELQDWMRPIMLRREKTDVLTELPPISYIDLKITLTSEGRAAATEAFQLGGYGAAGEFARSDEDTPLAEVLQRLGLAKASASIEHINSLREAGEDVLVLAHYHSTSDALATALGVPVVDGRSPPHKRRETLLDSLAKHKVVVAGITAVATGINLQAASSVVFVEPSPGRPDQITQSIDRAWRMGQTRPVSAFFVQAERAWVDKAIWDSLRRLDEGVQKVMLGI